ncbi:hypothetical protein Bca52824_018685 [Brassica carinata]|uniref:methenyltetrahydrofolate cyclohydrolase n=1 Tax=Brassica carinata TaxID=52824 RepID=A0A8X8AYV6_BRACI|nr:hypothetical protein Bca52824_018685 [Brassica carinata]
MNGVIVGVRKDSQTYVNMKRKACAEVGIMSFDVDLPEDVPEADLITKVYQLNSDPDVHSILVQLPLPKHINEENALGAISIDKDVDGFHPLNIGKLAMKGREPLFLPCTPKKWHKDKGAKSSCSRSVRRSNIVGLPVSLLLLKADATVTTVHCHTKNPEAIIKEADIIIAAAGQACMIKGDWIKPGAAVIDERSQRPEQEIRIPIEASKVAGFITPVPDGVGPMIVAMLLRNTLDGAKWVIGQ